MRQKKSTSAAKKKIHHQARSHGRNHARDTKVGDSISAARQVGGKGDFGARESDPIERGYASAAIRHQDKGGGVAHSSGAGTRTSGVGGNESGIGSSSGGDIDTDFIGLGSKKPATDDSTAASNPRRGPRSANQHRANPDQTAIHGSTVNRSGGDLSTTGSGQGTAAVTNSMARNDDSFRGEISNDEATGADNSPSDNE